MSVNGGLLENTPTTSTPSLSSLTNSALSSLNSTTPTLTAAHHFTNEFYLNLSNATIYVIVLISLFLISCFIISRFISKKHSIYCFDLIVMCAISLTTATMSLLLVPLASLAVDSLEFYPNNQYIKWINSSLMFGLSNTSFIGTNISLLVLLPLAYFYNEAVGKSKIRRLLEALSVMLIFCVIMLCFFGLFHDILFASEEGDSTLIFEALNTLLNAKSHFVLAYTFTSAIGSTIMLIVVPAGSQIIGNISRSLLSSAEKQEDSIPNDLLWACDYKRTYVIDYKAFLPFFMKLAANILAITNVVLPAYMISKVSYSLFYMFLKVEGGVYQLQQETINLNSPSAELLLDTSSILYIIATLLLGFYNLLGENLRPRIGKTRRLGVIVNIACILMVSSAFPIVTRMLCITKLDLVSFYGYAEYLDVAIFLFIFRLWFVGTMTTKLITHQHVLMTKSKSATKKDELDFI